MNERSPRMVTDAVRHDVRTTAVGDTSAKNASPQRSQRAPQPHGGRA